MGIPVTYRYSDYNPSYSSPPGTPMSTPTSFQNFVQPRPLPAFTRPENNPNLIRLQLQAMMAMMQPDYPGGHQTQGWSRPQSSQRPNFMESDFGGQDFGQSQTPFTQTSPTTFSRRMQFSTSRNVPQSLPQVPQQQPQQQNYWSPPMMGGTPYSEPPQQRPYQSPYQQIMGDYLDEPIPSMFRRFF